MIADVTGTIPDGVVATIAAVCQTDAATVASWISEAAGVNVPAVAKAPPVTPVGASELNVAAQSNAPTLEQTTEASSLLAKFALFERIQQPEMTPTPAVLLHVPTAEVRSVLNAASGATFGQAGMLPLVELMPHYSFILPKRKLSSSVMGNILGMAESGALVASPSKEVAFLSAVDKSLKAADRPGLMKAQVPVMMESMSVLDRAHTVKILRGLAKDNREYVLQLLNASPSSRFAELLSWLFPCTPESGGGHDSGASAMKETCRNLFILAGIGKPIGVDELFPANFLPGDIKSDYFKPMTLNSQIHSADSAAVTALVCGAEARIVEAMHEPGKYVIATPGFGAQVSRISKKTRGATSNKNRLLAAGFMAKERSDTVLYNRLYLALQTNVAVKKAIENNRLDPASYEEALDMAERTYLETLSGSLLLKVLLRSVRH